MDEEETFEDLFDFEEVEEYTEPEPEVVGHEVLLCLTGVGRYIEQGRTFLSGEKVSVSEEEADRLLKLRTPAGRNYFTTCD